MNKPERRLPAEWECPDPVVLMTLPHSSSDWSYMLPEALQCFENMFEAIRPYARLFVIKPETMATNDTWTRDYGPITIEMNDGSYRCLDFTFNGWGMKFPANLDNCVNRRLLEQGHFASPIECHKELVLEGGSIDSDGHGCLLVTSECLLEANRNPAMSREMIEDKLVSLFGLRKVLWLDHGYLAGDDTDSHIDTLARFAPDRRIVYVGCDDVCDEHYEALKAMEMQLQGFTDADGRPFELLRLPMADPVYDPDEGIRLPATYANYLVLPEAVIMPSYSSPKKDEEAARILAKAYNRKIVSVNCLPLIRQHGSLHCSTMQIPGKALKI